MLMTTNRLFLNQYKKTIILKLSYDLKFISHIFIDILRLGDN